MSFNKVDEALKSVGITLQTTDHQFRDFTDVILELADKWDTLDSAAQRYQLKYLTFFKMYDIIAS